MYAIETSNLVKTFGSYRAVDGLNLKVPHGCVYGFLGPNGAGKTTTIKMLIGLSKPTSGNIKIYGNEYKFGSFNNNQEIGFLPDVPNFYDWMTPREFLKLCGNLFSIEKKELDKRVDSLIELVGLQDAKKRIGGFSRGMKQRLGIAQALINNPRVVFLDEPTSALDPIGRKEVMDIIGKLSGRVTVFLSTHILSDIEKVCDRVVILNKGKMVLEDEIANLRERYSLNAFELEVDLRDKAIELLETLKKEKWVQDVHMGDNGELIIHASSPIQAKLEIPKILYQKSAGLKKFVALEPALEDIFMKVVNQQ